MTNEAANEELKNSAWAFVAAAWEVLETQHVVPLPAFHPYVEVGRDYFGPDLEHLEERARFEAAIERASPRFSTEVPLGERDFASPYIFSFLETCLARWTLSGEPVTQAGQVFQQSLVDLVSTLQSSQWRVACCRVISHLTTHNGEPLEVGGVRVTPIGGVKRGRAEEIIEAVIPGAASAFGRNQPFVYAPPEAVAVVEGAHEVPFEFVKDLSGRIDRFLMLVRLLYAGTCESAFEVQGETAPIRRFKPTLVRFRGAGPGLLAPTSMVRRTVRLVPQDDGRVEGLWNLLASAERDRPGMTMTSFAMAVQKFQLSYHAHAWYEQLVDLATAFEAALSGKDTTDVLLRLRTRASALLFTDRDPATNIFNDIGNLYSLRSSLVHGGELKEKDLAKRVRSVSTVPADAPFGIALGYMVDRLRDLVRRSILARICLASGDEPTWALGEDVGVDAQLADEANRKQWRIKWRQIIERIDALDAADRPREAVMFVSQEDQ